MSDEDTTETEPEDPTQHTIGDWRVSTIPGRVCAWSRDDDVSVKDGDLLVETSSAEWPPRLEVRIPLKVLRMVAPGPRFEPLTVADVDAHNGLWMVLWRTGRLWRVGPLRRGEWTQDRLKQLTECGMPLDDEGQPTTVKEG